jgi:hypothetical protein
VRQSGALDMIGQIQDVKEVVLEGVGKGQGFETKLYLHNIIAKNDK